MKHSHALRVAAALAVGLSFPVSPARACSAQEGLVYALVGDAPGDRFGTAIAGIGDVDADGCADFVVGAPRAEPNGAASGLARVFSGFDGRVLYTLEGGAASQFLGASVAGVGDVDGDGVPDFLVGAPRDPASGGSARLHSGASGALIRSFAGQGGDERFGHALCGLGDLDGDGRGDFAIAAPYSDAGGLNAGRVEVYSGGGGALLFAFDGQGFDLFGSSIAAAGDVDGDGLVDLLIGAPLSDVGAFNAGSAWIRSGADGSLLAAFHGVAVGDQLGQWVAGVGDFDGDGSPDVALGIPGADANGIDSGAVEVRSSRTGALLLRVVGPSSGVYMGGVAGLGDLDGDGRPEVLIGAPSAEGQGAQAGRALIAWGALGSPGSALFGRRPYDWFGAAVAGVGDVDSDGWPDLAIGAPGHEDMRTRFGYVQVFSGRALAAAR